MRLILAPFSPGFRPGNFSNLMFRPVIRAIDGVDQSRTYSGAPSGRAIWEWQFPGLKPWAKALQPLRGTRTAPPLHHSITPSLHRSTAPPLHRSTAPSLHHSTAPSLHHSITPSLHRSITPSLHHSITPSLHHSITPSLHHSITPSLQRSSRAGRRNLAWPIGCPPMRKSR